MPKMGTPLGGEKHKTDAMRIKELQTKIRELERRLNRLEHNTSPHVLAGYSDPACT